MHIVQVKNGSNLLPYNRSEPISRRPITAILNFLLSIDDILYYFQFKSKISRYRMIKWWCVVLGLCSLARCCAGTSRLDSPEWKDSFDGGKHGDEAGRDAYLQKYGAWNRVNPAVKVLGQYNVVQQEEVIFESTGSSKNNNNLNVDSFIDIHVCAHTHDDVGWTSTVFGYYNNSVQYILTSVMQALANNPSRRFIWSEIKWWEMWWPQQTPAMHDTVRRLVKGGQLEFVGA